MLATMDTAKLVLTGTIDVHDPVVELAPTYLRMVYNVNLLLLATIDTATLVLAEKIDVHEMNQSTQVWT